MLPQKVAGIQMKCVPDKATNIATAVSLVRDAASNGATIVCLQELFATQFFPATADLANFDLAEGDDGPTMTALSEVAREAGLWISAGVFERDPLIRGRYFNSILVTSPSGEVVGRYRKTYVPMRPPRNCERYYFTPGDVGVPVFDMDGLRVAFNICYDRHFPELARIAALQGAHLLVYPTAAQADPGRVNTWRSEMISRAGENLFYVMGVGRAGSEADRKYSGQSMIVDPYGRVLSELGLDDQGIVTAEIDPDVIDKARIDFAHLRDLRPEVYQRLFELTTPSFAPTVSPAPAWR